MAVVSTLRMIRRRASRRMIADLPLDLQDMELDDPLTLLVGRVKIPLEKWQASEKGKPPAARRPWFGIPASPHSSRLRSSDGLESLHFAINPTRERSAGGFDRYSTDKEEAKAISLGDLGPAASFDVYALGHGTDQQLEPSLSMVTTLDLDPDVRQRQWDEIEQFERSLRRNVLPGPPRINLRYERHAHLLLDAAGRPDCPSGLRSVILAERDRVARGEELPARLIQNGVPWISDDAPRGMNWLKNLPSWQQINDKSSPCAKLSPGRGVVTVIAGELELPSCFDAQGCSAVLNGFNEHVQGLLPTPVPEDPDRTVVIPFLGVKHRPGQLNDDRNTHLHFQIATRGLRISEGGELIFDEHKVPELTANGAIYKLRTAAAHLINVELERLGADYRLSPKTYAELGIEAATQVKLHGKQTVLERAGVPTGPGIDNVAEGWRREFAKAQAEHDAAIGLLDTRDTDARDRIARLRDVAAREQQERERALAYDEALRALTLQAEAAEIRIHIAMARSRPELTVKFARGYADKARRDGRDTWDSEIWGARDAAALDHLATLDADLAIERRAIEDREAEATRLQARADGRYKQIERDEQLIVRPASTAVHPARAVTLIADRGLYLSRLRDGLGVRPEHDPDGLVRGVDLSGQAKRLEGIRASQERELTQLRARVRKHGLDSLTDDALHDSTEWLRAAARRWRSTAILKQMVAADRGMARPHAQLVQDDIEWLPFDPVRGAPRTLGDLTREERANLPIEFAPEPIAPPQPAAAKKEPVEQRSAEPRSIFTEEERRVLRQRMKDQARERTRIDAAIQHAIEKRAGDGRSLTPHGARLLARLRDGFDPTRVDRHIGITGRTLDQRDAEEIVLLLRNPVFAERAESVRNGDAAVLRLIDETLRDHPVIDKLGRVTVVNGKLVFDNPAIVGASLHAPADLARQALDRLGDQMPRISRHKGVFGIHDREMIEHCGDNYIGLLDLQIQCRLKAIWRVQREEERALLRRVGRGEVKAVARLAPGSDQSVARDEVRGATDVEHRVADRHWADPSWYVACRLASVAPRNILPPRHADPVLNATLRAVDDRARPGVLDQLILRLRAIRPAPTLDELNSRDRYTIDDLLSGRRNRYRFIQRDREGRQRTPDGVQRDIGRLSD
ncbi:hypothetical protein FPZ24_04890 [Sphingomonas panacisoli]|uniref:MobA/MobL protein domain-containing protein n=1 Tax=Sphingomonas panacisoli TaxID=1813879 RepID=A0A5B8LG85_9SPHN|nr:hypothetical protein [Sphingomonas panacisoli]QDZ06896.1 hypothetical protein FPZ24_04890 [Sphingomonas panacisoli]